MTAPRWPVRPEHRRKPRQHVVTSTDVDADLLREIPTVLEELNACPAYIYLGDGRPGRGWTDWETRLVPLGRALELPWAGEA